MKRLGKFAVVGTTLLALLGGCAHVNSSRPSSEPQVEQKTEQRSLTERVEEGISYYKNGEFERAAKTFNSYLLSIGELEEHEKKDAALALYYMGLCCFEFGSSIETIESFFRRSLRLYEGLNDPEGMHAAKEKLKKLSYAKTMEGAESAFYGFGSGKYYAKSDEEPRRGSTESLILQFIWSGSTCFHSGNYDEAIEEYFKALEIIKESKEVSSKPSSQNEDIRTQVLRYYESEMIGAEGMINLFAALAFARKGQDDKAEEHFGCFWEFYEGIDHPLVPEHKLRALVGLADVYKEMGKYAKAKKKYEVGIDLIEKNNLGSDLVSRCYAGFMECSYLGE